MSHSLIIDACFLLLQRRAERLERMKDDPYYIVDDRPSKLLDDDVDSIPVVRLDDMPLLPKGSGFDVLWIVCRLTHV